MRTILITTCTGRKKTPTHATLHAAKLPKGKQNAVLSSWVNALKAQSCRTAARKVYCGRGFSEILDTVRPKGERFIELDLWVISAGLGLINSNLEIPSYNLTISPSTPDSIQLRITHKTPFDPRLWWRELNKALYRTPTPLANLIRKNNDALFVISMSRPYAEMVVDDLLSLEPSDQQRIRILGLSRSFILPLPLQSLCMPYDERYDGLDSTHTGTRSDFPQRVTRHFVENILTQSEENSQPLDHSKKVTAFLEGKRTPVLVKRARKTDDEINLIILKRWDDARGSATVMLRILRDKEEIACEQKRFGRLFKEIKAGKNGQI